MNKENRENLRDLLDKAEHGRHDPDVLGVMVQYGFRNVEVMDLDLQNIFAKNGLDFDLWGPPALEPNSTIVRKAIKRVNGKKDAQAFLFRPVKVADPDFDHWTVVEESADSAAKDNSYDPQAKIEFDKRTNHLKISGTPGTKAFELAEEVEDLYNRYTSHYISRDLSDCVKLHCKDTFNGVATRPGGGSYFVLQSAIPTLEQLESALEDGDIKSASSHEESKKGVKLYVLRRQDKANIRSTGKDAVEGLEGELSKLKKEIKDYVQDTPRESALETKLTQFRELKEKVGMYHDVLEFNKDTLEQGIKDAATFLKSLMTGIKEERENKKDADKKVTVQVDAPTASTVASLKDKLAARKARLRKGK